METKFLGEEKFGGNNSLSFTPNTGVSSGFIKILAIRINTLNVYQAYVIMTGHAGKGEWDNSGFYLGRNGWLHDANFMLEYTLTIVPTAQKITGAGQATFVNGNNTILGYESHGFVVTNQPVTSIQILFTGGVSTGISRFYLM